MARKTKSKNKIADIRKLSDANLRKELDETYRKMFDVQRQKSMLQLANHREIPQVRRSIARLKTIQRQRELAKEHGGAS
jgi:large subunit ribosomal protein L29